MGECHNLWLSKKVAHVPRYRGVLRCLCVSRGRILLGKFVNINRAWRTGVFYRPCYDRAAHRHSAEGGGTHNDFHFGARTRPPQCADAYIKSTIMKIKNCKPARLNDYYSRSGGLKILLH